MAKGWFEAKDPSLGKARRHSEVVRKRGLRGTLREPISEGGRSHIQKHSIASISAPNSRAALAEARRQYNKIVGSSRQIVTRVKLLARGDPLGGGRRTYSLYSVFVKFIPIKQPPEILTVREDRMGNITVTSNVDPGSVFLQFEADKELIYDLLRRGEREDLERGWDVEIRGDEPRASVIAEIWEAQNPDSEVK